jgi:hypothetical protein
VKELGAPLPVRVAGWALLGAGTLGALALWADRGPALWLDAVLAFCG